MYMCEIKNKRYEKAMLHMTPASSPSHIYCTPHAAYFIDIVKENFYICILIGEKIHPPLPYCLIPQPPPLNSFRKGVPFPPHIIRGHSPHRLLFLVSHLSP